MDLPQELIDEIIDNIPPNDRKSLRSCSLVAKSWVYPSRRRIFRSVDISGAACLGSWLDKIPPTNIEILQHVHSLTYRIANTPGSPHPSIDFLRDYSPSFRQLEHLTFLSGFLGVPSASLTEIGTLPYPAFQRTVSHLCLPRKMILFLAVWMG